MDKDKMKLQRVIITRRTDNRFDVVRERKENGETGGGYETLEEAFDYVRCIYDKHGEFIPQEGIEEKEKGES